MLLFDVTAGYERWPNRYRWRMEYRRSGGRWPRPCVAAVLMQFRYSVDTLRLCARFDRESRAFVIRQAHARSGSVGPEGIPHPSRKTTSAAAAEAAEASALLTAGTLRTRSPRASRRPRRSARRRPQDPTIRAHTAAPERAARAPRRQRPTPLRRRPGW